MCFSRYSITFILFALLVFAPLAKAQQTTVQATVKDASGNPYSNCNVTANYVDPPAGTPGVTRAGTINGSPIPTRTISTSCNSSAFFTIILWDTALISYGGTTGGGTWQFTLSATQTTPLPGQPTTPRFSYTAPICPVVGCITGASIDISVALQAASVLLPIVNNPASLSGNNTFTGNNTIASPGSLTVSGTATVGKLNGVCVIDGVKYTTLAAAFGDAGCQVIDDSGFLSGGTIASTITFPARAVHLTLGIGTYTGPASGSAFALNDFHSNGSSIIGQGITGGESPNRLPVTVIKSNAANTSALIAMGEPNTSGIVQGIALSQLMLDGNSIAVNCMTMDSVANGYFDNLDCENTTGPGLATVVTGSVANNGVQFNRMLHWKFNNVNGCASFDGNSAKTSDFTQNYLWDWTCNFTGTGNPGLEFIAGDSNWLFAIRSFRSGGTAYDIKFDNVQASHLGGLANEIYGFHGNPTNTIDCEFAVTGGGQTNQVFGYSVTENQADPLINGNSCLSWYPTGMIANPGTYSGPRAQTPSIFPSIELFTQSASIASTPLGTTGATANGHYEIHYVVQTDQVATTSGSVVLSITSNDGYFGGATTANIPSPANVLGDSVSGTIDVRSGNSQAISYSTTYSSVGATVYKYHIKITVEYKG